MLGLTEFWRNLCMHQCNSYKIPSAFFYLFSSLSVFPPLFLLTLHHYMPLQCGVGAMGMHQLHQVSYTIKRKPLSALSNVLRKLRHHTASIHEIRHQYEKVRTNTISNVYNSKQGDKGTRNLCRLKLVQEDKSSSYASSMFLNTWSYMKLVSLHIVKCITRWR